jgi:hypothetical protein
MFWAAMLQSQAWYKQYASSGGSHGAPYFVILLISRTIVGRNDNGTSSLMMMRSPYHNSKMGRDLLMATFSIDIPSTPASASPSTLKVCHISLFLFFLSVRRS